MAFIFRFLNLQSASFRLKRGSEIESSFYSKGPSNYRERKSILKKEVNFMDLINVVVLIIIAIELALIYVRLGEGKN